MQVMAWEFQAPAQPMARATRQEVPGPGDVLIQVAGCGVCHTDLGFYYDGVPTRHTLPLTLGHEISGLVVAAGEGAEQWLQKQVIVPAVMPCGTCLACKEGHGAVCPKQIFPGNDVHGGFASHVKVPSAGLCAVPDLDDPLRNPMRLDLATLSVIADAVTTPYQAILRSGLKTGDLAVFVGVGGVGSFGVQIAAAMGATTVAIDVDQDRLSIAGEHGAALTLSAKDLDFREIRKQVRKLAADQEVPGFRQKIFETSGTPAGQGTAYGLLEHGGYLSIVGFTPEKLNLRLSNLMAFDATVQGNWGCLPEHYPAVLDLVLNGRVKLAPFVEKRPLASINQTFQDLHEHKVSRRVILLPDE